MPIKYHLCISFSWESGQDVSGRFGPQQTGGIIIQHVQPMDLQASMAQGAAILAHWAALLGETQPGATTIELPINLTAEKPNSFRSSIRREKKSIYFNSPS
jgi:hypothetical protein